MTDPVTTARVAAALAGDAEKIIARWSAETSQVLRGRLSVAELDRQVRELFSALRQTLDAGDLRLDAPGAAELRSVLTDLSATQARQGFTATQTAAAVFAAKQALVEVIDPAAESGTYLAIARLIDEMGLFTFESYTQTREAVINEQAEQLLELSTPVVKLWDGVVGVPLVGTLDSARAQVTMERLLQGLVDTGSPYAIIDITGVPAVDTQVAQHILKTVVAARLMGAECVISGIRPQIAQTVVALGIDFGDIVTKASLADALVHVLRASGVDLVRRAPRRGA